MSKTKTDHPETTSPKKAGAPPGKKKRVATAQEPEFYPDVREKSVRFILHRIHENLDRFRSDFPMWISRNHAIWRRFEQEANFLWINGRRHYSARTIIEFIRHETNVRQLDTDFKINNSYVPDLARLYGLLHPERPLFECRVMSGKGARRRIRRA